MAAINPFEAGPRPAVGAAGALRQAPASARRPEATPGTLFDEALAAERLHLSHHARQRLASRQVALSQADLARIADGVDRAAAKGSRDSLVLLDQLALIVNVPNRTVLTALDSGRLNEGVVTNIDSTVFV